MRAQMFYHFTVYTTPNGSDELYSKPVRVRENKKAKKMKCLLRISYTVPCEKGGGGLEGSWSFLGFHSSSPSNKLFFSLCDVEVY